MNVERAEHTDRLYAVLDDLASRVGGPRCLRECTRRDGWPSHCVYFFYEPGELRTGGALRVVRVGTHALRESSRTTLWNRLAQHRGTRAGGGHHRGSIFRHHVGSALITRQRLGDDVLAAWSNTRRDPQRAGDEATVERMVSEHIGRMPFLWLAVPTLTEGTSLRGHVERNCIALLSNATGGTDVPSEQWLGRHAVSPKVRESGLWNVNHIDEQYDPAFLDTMQSLVDETPPTK